MSASAAVGDNLYIVGGVSDESNYYSRLTTEKITKDVIKACGNGDPTGCQTEIASNGIPMQGNIFSHWFFFLGQIPLKLHTWPI